MFYERSNSQNKATGPPIGALEGDDKKRNDEEVPVLSPYDRLTIV